MIYPFRIVSYFLMIFLVQKTEPEKVADQEYLDWNKLKINNQLPLLCKKVELVKLLGKTDSTITPHYEDICVSYFDTSFQYIYFGESQFEILGDMAVVSIIDLESSNIKLVSPKLTLDRSVTLEKIKRIFPNAVKNAEFIEVDKKGKLQSIKVATAKEDTDDAWILFFRKGNLIRIDHWMPC